MPMSPHVRTALKIANAVLRTAAIYGGFKAARERDVRERELIKAVRQVDQKLDALARLGGVSFTKSAPRREDGRLGPLHPGRPEKVGNIPPTPPRPTVL